MFGNRGSNGAQKGNCFSNSSLVGSGILTELIQNLKIYEQKWLFNSLHFKFNESHKNKHINSSKTQISLSDKTATSINLWHNTKRQMKKKYFVSNVKAKYKISIILLNFMHNFDIDGGHSQLFYKNNIHYVISKQWNILKILSNLPLGK